ncbi:MAG: SPOR domain-containing protein [Desulfuromonadales bacterium]|nr:SPOR domain-containing protein [Desulfuromonadales bacterium]
MRIDYSEPKKAYVTHQGTSRPRKEPAGLFTTILVVTAAIAFVAGFGSGWFFSQKSAKKSFQAAIEQNSLESSPKKEITPPPKPAQLVQPIPTPQPQPDSAGSQQTPAGTAPPTAAQPLGFYKSLPSGQQSAMLGSGINVKDDKTKQPLQAALPSNMVRPPTADPSKAPTDKPAGSEKPATKSPENSGLTVQVASFPLKSEAEALKNKLAGKGYNAFIVESHQGDKGTWYRVRIGKKLEQEAAKELAAKLGKGSLVIPDRE